LHTFGALRAANHPLPRPPLCLRCRRRRVRESSASAPQGAASLGETPMAQLDPPGLLLDVAPPAPLLELEPELELELELIVE
jgi:hypothetical protein